MSGILNLNFALKPIASGGSLLLDTYTGAKVAYSLRKLKSSATNCLRIRRSSDNAEQDIGFSGGYIDTASLTSFVGANNGFVVKWYDQSGNANDLTQSTAGSQPKLVSSGTIETQNFLASIKFSGSEYWSYTTAFSPSNVFTTFTVQKRDSSGKMGAISSNSSTLASPISPLLYTDNNMYLQWVSSGTSGKYVSVAQDNSDFNLLTGFANNTTAGQMWVNDESVVNTSPNNFTSSSSNMTDFGNGGGTKTTGWCSEFILYDSDKSSNVAAIDLDIQTYWNLLYGYLGVWSVRKYISSYSGSCMRIRRSSDNAEQDIGFSGNDLDTSAISSFVGSNSAYVVKWYDQSGFGNHAVQTTTTKQPLIVSSGTLNQVNSKPSLLFDGTDDHLVLTTTLYPWQWASFMVVKRAASSNIGGVLSTSGNYSPYTTWLYSDNTIYLHNTPGYVASSSTYSTATQQLFTALTNGTNLNMYVDGSSIANGGYTVNGTTSGFDILGGRTYSGSPQYTNGNIQETILCGVNQTNNRTSIESNIRTYFGF